MRPIPIHLALLATAPLGLAQTTQVVSTPTGVPFTVGESSAPAISDDGTLVVFTSSQQLLPEDLYVGDDIYLRDTRLGTTQLISVDSNGGPSDGDSVTPAISADGSAIAFRSQASNLGPGLSGTSYQIFHHDLQTGVTTCVSLDASGLEGNARSYYPVLSADGRYVAFESLADNLVANDTNGQSDIFLHDTQTGITERISLAWDGSQAMGRSCYRADLTADARYVTFETMADHMVPGDTDGVVDIFRRDRVLQTTERVSLSSSGHGLGQNTSGARISDNGHIVAFSCSDGLVRYRNLLTGITEVASIGSLGDYPTTHAGLGDLSGNGRYISWQTTSSMVPNDTADHLDVYVFDRLTGTSERVSVTSTGIQGDDDSSFGALSWDGRHVAFQSMADNFGGPIAAVNVFHHDRWDGQGANSIHLTGPGNGTVGVPLDLEWFAAPPLSAYWLIHSLHDTGTVQFGHAFDFGMPVTVLASGVTPIQGHHSFVTPPLPGSLAGLTLHFEIAARDGNGVLFDSNLLSVPVP